MVSVPSSSNLWIIPKKRLQTAKFSVIGSLLALLGYSRNHKKKYVQSGSEINLLFCQELIL